MANFKRGVMKPKKRQVSAYWDNTAWALTRKQRQANSVDRLERETASAEIAAQVALEAELLQEDMRDWGLL